MRIVVAMNAFKGSLSAVEATSLVAQGFKQGYREADVIEAPMADGGDGTTEVLTRAFEGRFVSRTVTGPHGEPVDAQIGIIDFGQTAVIESAKASGLALMLAEKRDVRTAQSTGVGELMLWAAGQGVKRMIVGIGGTATNDGGIGAVQAAGGLILDREGRQVGPGLQGLFQVAAVEAGAIRSAFEGIDVIAACDVQNALTGVDGATRVYGPQKGLGAGEVGEVDREMERYASVLARDLRRDPTGIPMTGAGGGLASALWAFFGAKLVNGAKFIMSETGLAERIEDADLVITGEGRVDFQTAKGKVPFAVARVAAEKGIPAIAIGGSLGEDVIRGYPPEFSALFAAVTRPVAEKDAMAGARDNLAFAAEQIGRVARVFALSFPVQTDESAGGVVVQEDGSERQVLLIADKYGFAAPPKGHAEAGETLDQAAVREVCEETGIRAEILQDIGPMRYRFPGHDGRPIHKTVHYYLMRPVGGVLKPQAGETFEVKWVRERDLPTLKTYRGTHVLIERAMESLDEIGRTTEAPGPAQGNRRRPSFQ